MPQADAITVESICCGTISAYCYLFSYIINNFLEYIIKIYGNNIGFLQFSCYLMQPINVNLNHKDTIFVPKYTLVLVIKSLLPTVLNKLNIHNLFMCHRLDLNQRQIQALI